MDTLQPLEDFVLQRKNDNQTLALSYIDFLQVIKYAEFLKSTHLLKHFIECDEKGDPIQEPEIYSQWLREKDDDLETEYIIKQCYEFQQAQKQVLFEGFEKDEEQLDRIVLTNGNIKIHFFNSEMVCVDFNDLDFCNTYSDLTKYQIQTNNNFKELIYGK